MPWSVAGGGTQVNSGLFLGTSGSASLPAATTAGNTVLLVIGHGTAVFTAPTGFTRDGAASGGGAAALQAIYRKTAVDGETSWSFSLSQSAMCEWWAVEVEGLDNTAPVDTTPQFQSTGSGTSIDSAGAGSNVLSTVYDGLVVAAYTGNNATNSTVPSFSGYGQGLTEYVDIGQSSGATAHGLAVALASVAAPTTWDVAATTSVSCSALSGVHVVYACTGSRRLANLVQMAGFEWGTTAGLATGPAGAAPFDVVTGSPAIVSTSPRTGSYCLEVSASAAAENVQWNAGSIALYGSSAYLVARFAVYSPSPLPGADLDVASLNRTTAGADVVLRYRSASGTLKLQVGAGTEQAGPTVAANTWYGIDVRFDVSGTTYLCDWQVDGVDQTQATLSGQVASTANMLVLGWTGASTGTVRYDDVAVSQVRGQYPIGDVRVYPLAVDPSGTVTISGTTSNFGVMTANGTVGAWNATNARNAIDDIPPDLSATRDALVMVTASATDYAEIPMATRNAAANGESIRGAKLYLPLWAASATAATIRVNVTDGTDVYALYAEADPNADATATPAWVCRMVRSTSSPFSPPVWTQPRVDGLAVRVGSNDATPDIGVDAALVELAMRAGEARTVIGESGTPASTAGAVDPDSGAVISTTLAPVGLGATLRWTDSGGSGSQSVAAGGSYTRTYPSAVDVSEVTLIEVDPDADPDQPG